MPEGNDCVDLGVHLASCCSWLMMLLEPRAQMGNPGASHSLRMLMDITFAGSHTFEQELSSTLAPAGANAASFEETLEEKNDVPEDKGSD